MNIVLDGGFGAFHKKPLKIASTVSEWIQDELILDEVKVNEDSYAPLDTLVVLKSYTFDDFEGSFE